MSFQGAVPQMNKFELVSSHDHQMSVAGRRSPGLMSFDVPYHVTYPMMHMMYLHPNACEQADNRDNITFPKLRLRVVNVNTSHSARNVLHREPLTSILQIIKHVWCLDMFLKAGSTDILSYQNLSDSNTKICKEKDSWT